MKFGEVSSFVKKFCFFDDFVQEANNSVIYMNLPRLTKAYTISE